MAATYVASDQLRVNHAGHLAVSVESAAREVLEDSASIGEATHAGTGWAVGVKHCPIKRYTRGAAAEHQRVCLSGDKGPAALGCD